MAQTERFLTLMRHGKAARDLEGIADFDRPVNERGVTDAALVASALRDRTPPLGLALLSNARRARVTGEIVAGILSLPSGGILLEETLYGAEPEEILYRIRELPPEPSHVLVVGHNPAMEEAAGLLSGSSVGSLPTAAAVCFRVYIDRWAELSTESAFLEEVIIPKSLKQG